MDKKLLIQFEVKKSEIIHKQTERMMGCIRTLSQMESKGYNSLLLYIDGYNDIPDELYEIPEVRIWMKKLFRIVPHFLYYIFQEEEDSYGRLLACITDVESAYQGEWLPTSSYNIRNVPRYTYKVNIKNEDYFRLEKAMRNHILESGNLDHFKSLDLFNKVLGIKEQN
ncbi:hypothetical protein [Paenibacillus terrae]|uniref:Uncharacterized protein n=1 Tax=Paenibacillus terrae TaxID=159743 RepID=A0A0D7X1R3_9BACL|nr:hypothetical protein [Paenibacillus terrae]KJD43982.1 hypothetical protein QD47_19430 [Paenibacillus terrae]